MRRRTLLATAATAFTIPSLRAALAAGRWDEAVAVLDRATADKQVESAVLHVSRKGDVLTKAFGKAATGDAMFLLGSISKPINVAAMMTQFDRGKFRLDDRVKAYIPAFTGDGRDDVTIQHLLTHTSGLPDQLAKNNELRRGHAPLSGFVAEASRAPLDFAAGSKYQYSSMGILLAARIGELVSGVDMLTLVNDHMLKPLGMTRSAAGLGKFAIGDMVACQAEGAAPESGGGDPTAKTWDWNSPYWRSLGAPWGGVHASAPDLARFLGEFLDPRGQALRPETARLMTRNHNPAGLTPRGLGFVVGDAAGSPGCSPRTFGHTGSTGTLFWADPASETICVVLTSLPARAVKPHPRDLASARVADT